MAASDGEDDDNVPLLRMGGDVADELSGDPDFPPPKPYQPPGFLDAELEVALRNILQQLQEEERWLEPTPVRRRVLPSLDLAGVAKFILSGKCKKIVAISGPGISVSAGIPDFRSEGNDLFDALAEHPMPSANSLFDVEFFKENPEPFFCLARHIYPLRCKPTPCHYFLRLLAEKNLLLRNYTQNIDTLERVAGIPDDKIVEGHGSFHTATCINDACQKRYMSSFVRSALNARTIPKCDTCGDTVKPDISFFGEELPARFFLNALEDLGECDLLIAIGTSLQVRPFASLINEVRADCPRLLINGETVGVVPAYLKMLGMTGGFEFGEGAHRDVQVLGSCDHIIMDFATHLGWEDELQEMITKGHAQLDRLHSSVKDP